MCHGGHRGQGTTVRVCTLSPPYGSLGTKLRSSCLVTGTFTCLAHLQSGDKNAIGY